jgi:hypothetical protein
MQLRLQIITDGSVGVLPENPRLQWVSHIALVSNSGYSGGSSRAAGGCRCHSSTTSTQLLVGRNFTTGIHTLRKCY